MATSEKKTTTAPLSPKTKSKILAETEKSLKETHDMFLYNKAYGRIPEPPGYMKESIKRKIMEEYEPYIHEKFEINKGKRLKILKRLGVTSTNAQEQKLEEGGFANKGVSRKRKKLGEGDEEKKVPPQSALGEIIKGIDEEQGISSMIYIYIYIYIYYREDPRGIFGREDKRELELGSNEGTRKREVFCGTKEGADSISRMACPLEANACDQWVRSSLYIYIIYIYTM